MLFLIKFHKRRLYKPKIKSNSNLVVYSLAKQIKLKAFKKKVFKQ
jgi:hypothetical protein